MHPTDRKARIAGGIYLLLVIVGFVSLMYLPRTLIVSGDAAATAESVLAHEGLYRLGVSVELIAMAVFVLLALALHRLLAGVSQAAALGMVALVLVSAGFGLVSVQLHLGALSLFRGGEFLTVLAEPQRHALAMFLLELHHLGLVVNETFWGLWLLPLGYLVIRSGFLPKILGILLLINGAAYVALSFTQILLPQHGPAAARWATPVLMGEVVFTLWLLFMGAKVKPEPASA